MTGDDLEAIECYTLSLAYANNDQLMAYAFANRSAALYRKRLYKECLIDIDAALNHGYPKEKRKRLKERGDRAIMEIKKLLEADSEDGDARKIADALSPSGSNEQTNTKYIVNETTREREREEARERDSTTNENYLYYVTKVPPQKPRYLQNDDFSKLTYGPSKQVPAVSYGIAASFSERYGRHYVATRNFNPGDVVSIEDPYARVIYEER